MPDLATNVLYYGDNLDILRRYLPDAAVDLVYLDPPFNSNTNYNVLFAEKDGIVSFKNKRKVKFDGSMTVRKQVNVA